MTETITGTLTILRSKLNSPSGGPNFELYIGDSEKIHTNNDYSLNWGITNHKDKVVTATVRYKYGKLRLETLKEA